MQASLPHRDPKGGLLDLSEWTSALFDYLVAGKGEPETPLFVYVDRSVLVAVSGAESAASAVEDFCHAYAAGTSRSAPFDPASFRTRSWLQAGPRETPPFFSALCMTVLAVTEPSAHGVYMAQNQLLGLPSSTDSPPGYARDVPYLWGLWNKWLEGNGSKYGIPTATSHATYTYQGWARSQAKIREKEREIIFEYFDSIQLSGIETGSDLLQGIRTWLRFKGAAYGPFRELLADEQAQDILVALLPTFLTNWFRRDRTSHRSIAAKLALATDSWWLDLVVDLDQYPWLRGRTLQGKAHEEITVGIQDTLLYVTPQGPNLSVVDRPQSIPLASDVGVRWPLPPTIFLQPWDSGTLIQSSTVEWHTTYKALVPTSKLRETLEEMRSFGASPSEVTTLNTWTLVEDVKFVSAPADLAESQWPWFLAPADGRIQLRGGLPLGNAAVYLEGGEPDVVVDAQLQFNGVEVDGRRARPAIVERGLLRLREMYLDPGNHKVRVGERELNFRMEPPERIAQLPWLDESSADKGDLGNAAPWPILRVPLHRTHHSELIVLLSAGEVLSIDISKVIAPSWLGVTSPRSLVDLAWVIPRALSNQVALVAFRSSTRTNWTLVDVPDGFTFAGSATTLPSQTTISDLVAAPGKRWIPKENLGKLGHLLNLRTHAINLRVPSERPEPQEPQAQNDDADGGEENPFDDFIAWMSELESGESSLARARSTWNWLASVYAASGPDAQFEQVIRNLAKLGHVRVDWGNQKLRVQPTSLADLPNAMGLRVWTGARPTRVLAGLTTGAADEDNAHLASLAQQSQLHKRRQTGPDGRVNAPDAIYVELADYPTLKSDLHALGYFDGVEESVTSLGASLAERFSQGHEWVNPHRLDRQVLSLHQWRRFEWRVATKQSDAFGVGKYVTSRGPTYTYRSPNGGPEREVRFDVGVWLWMASEYSRDLVAYDAPSNTILVPAILGLPSSIERFLVGRSGLLPRDFSGITPLGDPTIDRFYAYENCTFSVAEDVVATLGRTHQNLMSAVRIPARQLRQ